MDVESIVFSLSKVSFTVKNIIGSAAKAFAKIPHLGTAGRIMGKVAGFGARHILPKVAGLFAGPVGWAFDVASVGYDLYSLYNFAKGKFGGKKGPKGPLPVSPKGRLGKTLATGAVGAAAGIGVFKTYQEVTRDTPKVNLPPSPMLNQKGNLPDAAGQKGKASPSCNKTMNCTTNNNQQYRINIVVQPSSADPMQIAQQVQRQLEHNFPRPAATQTQKAIHC